MPIMFEEPTVDTITLRSPMGGPLPKAEKPEGSVLGAAFRQENLPYNLATTLFKSRPQPEPGYNPFDEIRDTEFEFQFADSFTYSQSRAETSQIKGKIVQENKDRARLEAAGSLGFAAQVAAGLIDPSILIPGGALVRGIRGGVSVTKSAMLSAAVLGSQGFGSEVGLQSAQQTRRPEESVMNVGVSTMLGVLLGGGAAAMLSKGERTAMEGSLRQSRASLAATVSNRGIGAAQVDTRTLDLTSFVPSWISSGATKAAETAGKVPIVGRALKAVVNLPEILSTRTSPLMRVLTGPSLEGRRILSDLAEIPLRVEENVRGIPTSSFGVPLEREIRNAVRQAEFQLTKEAEDAFRKFRFDGRDVKFAKLRASLDRRINKSEALTFDEFMEEVDGALRNGDAHEIPEVQTLAGKFRKVIDGPFEKAKALNILDDSAPLGAVSYAPRRFVREKVIAEQPEFISRYVEWRKQEQAINAKIQQEIAPLKDKMAKLEGDQAATVRAHLAELVTKWHGKTSELADTDQAVERILKADTAKNDLALKEEALGTFNEIIGTPDGRLPKDDPGYGRFSGPAEQQGRGPLMARRLAMPDNMLLPFLDRNPLRYTSVYLRSMLSDLGTFERFGDFDMKLALKRVQDEADIAMNEAKSGAERTKITDDRDKVIADLAAIRDRLKGVYGFSPDRLTRNIGKISQILGDFDVTTNMGSSGLSQFSDFATTVARYAFTGTKALGPAYRSLLGHLMKTSDTFAKARSEYRSIGIGTETFLNSRAHELADMGDIYQPASKAARIMRTGAEATMVLSGSSMMTDWAKTIAAIAAGNNLLRASRAVAEGKATSRMITDLAEMNIDGEMAEKIWGAFEAGGGRVDNGVHLPNTQDWSDLQARKMFEAAVGRETDIAVATPGEEKPLFLSTPTLALIGKYKSFVAAAHTRILMANLQRRDASTLSGLIVSLALGSLVYAVRAPLTGIKLSDRPQDWIKESVDRAGILGWFSEANAMAAKMTRGSGDIWNLVGADKPLSRFASRSILGSLTGPIGGKIESAAQITGAAATGDWSPSDVHKLRQLLPFQNLFYVRRLIDEVEANARDTFGIEGPGQRAN